MLTIVARCFIIGMAVLFSTGFTSADFEDNDEQRFEINITYVELPGSLKTKYSVNNDKLTVCLEDYSTRKKGFVDFAKRVYRRYDKEKLLFLLENTDWASIPKKLETPTIDGYWYKVSILMGDNYYSFYIDNTYHPTFDALFVTLNQLIPTEKGQQKYHLNYSDSKNYGK